MAEYKNDTVASQKNQEKITHGNDGIPINIGWRRRSLSFDEIYNAAKPYPDWKENPVFKDDLAALYTEEMETEKGETVLANDPSFVNVGDEDWKENPVFKEDLAALYTEEMETQKGEVVLAHDPSFGYRRFVEEGKSVCNNFAIGSMAMIVQNLATIPPLSSKIRRHMMMAANGGWIVVTILWDASAFKGTSFW